MKKIVLFFIAFGIFCVNLFSQKVPYTSQEFILRELVMKENKSSFEQHLSFNFKIFGKYNQDQIEPEKGRLNADYTLKFWLADANGDTIAKAADKSMFQHFSFFDVDTGKFKSYSFAHSITVPYHKFKRNGNVSFYLWGQAQNSNGSIQLKPFKAGIFNANIPKVVPLENQHINVSSAAINVDTKKYPGKGLIVNFNTDFKYSIEELFSEKENSDEVIFYVDFTTADGAPVTMPNNPQLNQGSRMNPNYYTIGHKKNITRQGEIFIPYIQFFLPQGLQEIHYTIHAVSKNYTKKWENLAQGKFNFQMPPVYFAKAAIKNIRVADKSYDVALKDIPILGLFVSSKSTHGKGYPDLFWNFGTDYQKFISTEIVHNTHYAPNDSCFFQMMEGDVLNLNVYDYDTFTFNDKLGSFAFRNFTGESLKQKGLKMGDVLDGEISIERRQRPLIPTIDIQSKVIKYKGITGYQVYGNITNNNSNLQTQKFVRLADGSQEAPTWQTMQNIPENANFSYFTPAWSLPNGAGFGILVIDSYFHLPLSQKFANPDTYFTETNDVQLNIKQLQPSVQNGVEGVILDINVVYPEGLTNKGQCKFKYQFRESSGADLKNIIEKLKLNGSPICDGTNCAMNIFIPYYILPEFSNKKISALFQSEISINNQFIIGKNSETLSAQIPTIVRLPKAKLSMSLKFAKSWSYVSIATEFNGKQEVFVKERTEGGNIETEVKFPSEFASENDVVAIVITPYEFRTALTPIRWEIKVKDLNNGVINLAKTKNAKKVLLKTN